MNKGFLTYFLNEWFYWTNGFTEDLAARKQKKNRRKMNNSFEKEQSLELLSDWKKEEWN